MDLIRQDIVLFCGTLADNIRCAAPQADGAAVAAEGANRRPAARPRDVAQRGQAAAFRRPAPAHRDCARAASGPLLTIAGRCDLRGRRGHRGGDHWRGRCAVRRSYAHPDQPSRSYARRVRPARPARRRAARAPTADSGTGLGMAARIGVVDSGCSAAHASPGARPRLPSRSTRSAYVRSRRGTTCSAMAVA